MSTTNNSIKLVTFMQHSQFTYGYCICIWFNCVTRDVWAIVRRYVVTTWFSVKTSFIIQETRHLLMWHSISTQYSAVHNRAVCSNFRTTRVDKIVFLQTVNWVVRRNAKYCNWNKVIQIPILVEPPTYSMYGYLQVCKNFFNAYLEDLKRQNFYTYQSFSKNMHRL